VIVPRPAAVPGPAAGGRLTAEFLNKNLKSSDAHVVHRIEQDVWSNLLSQEERAKVVRGAIDSNCVVWRYPEMKGPDGYLQLIQMFKAAVPGASPVRVRAWCSAAATSIDSRD
jgi:hypothetical protein